MRWNVHGTNLCQVKCSPPATSGFKIRHVLVRWQVCYVGFDPRLYTIIAGMVSAQQPGTPSGFAHGPYLSRVLLFYCAHSVGEGCCFLVAWPLTEK